MVMILWKMKTIEGSGGRTIFLVIRLLVGLACGRSPSFHEAQDNCGPLFCGTRHFGFLSLEGLDVDTPVQTLTRVTWM